MLTISSQPFLTAGVYVLAQDRFVFQVGLTKSGDALGVVRLGGHREREERGWDCAAREAFEEAQIHITSLHPPAIYLTESDEHAGLRVGNWQPHSPDEVMSVLVSKNEQDNYVTPMYLGSTDEQPLPGAEAKALLLVSPDHVHWLVKEPVTLAHYLAEGGQIVLRSPLPEHLPLKPFRQFYYLDKLLQIYNSIPGVMQP